MNAALGTARKGAAAGVGTTIGRASGTYTFSGATSATQTLTVNGRVYTYVATGPWIEDDLLHPALVPGYEGAEAYAVQFAMAINGGTYGGTPHADVYATVAGAVVTLYARAAGVGGNAITLAETATNCAISGATLTGGA